MSNAELDEDDDIKQEIQALANLNVSNSTSTTKVPSSSSSSSSSSLSSFSFTDLPLNWQPNQGGHSPSQQLQNLLSEVGGPAAIKSFTSAFYKKAFLDPQLDQFIRDHDDPHGERFADWIVEKFSGDEVWTRKLQKRQTCPFSSHGHTFQTPHDRSSAHYAAWHSPKRLPGTFGDHFKLDDARVWMRLHFWALRETGGFERSPSFANYYVKFIGHFVSIYERSATQFARESARWSESEENTSNYLSTNPRRMPNVIGLKYSLAIKQLPAEERDGNNNGQWPYDE